MSGLRTIAAAAVLALAAGGAGAEPPSPGEVVAAMDALTRRADALARAVEDLCEPGGPAAQRCSRILLGVAEARRSDPTVRQVRNRVAEAAGLPASSEEAAPPPEARALGWLRAAEARAAEVGDAGGHLVFAAMLGASGGGDASAMLWAAAESVAERSGDERARWLARAGRYVEGTGDRGVVADAMGLVEGLVRSRRSAGGAGALANLASAWARGEVRPAEAAAALGMIGADALGLPEGALLMQQRLEIAAGVDPEEAVIAVIRGTGARTGDTGLIDLAVRASAERTSAGVRSAR